MLRIDRFLPTEMFIWRGEVWTAHGQNRWQQRGVKTARKSERSLTHHEEGRCLPARVVVTAESIFLRPTALGQQHSHRKSYSVGAAAADKLTQARKASD